MAYGSDEHKRTYLPGILQGEINFAIGYTEPEAGTDLASLRTRAVLDGDEWVIDGNKVFTSGANQADYVWLACRTDPDAPKHKGISIIIVPTVVTGLQDDADRHRRQRRHAGDVLRRRAGAAGQRRRRGQRRLAAHHEPAQPRARRPRRARRAHVPPLRRRGRVVPRHASGRDAGGTRWWRRRVGGGAGESCSTCRGCSSDLARAHAKLEALKLLNWRMAGAVADGTLGPADASAAKVYGVETQVEAYRLFLGILGAVGLPRGRLAGGGAPRRGRAGGAGGADQHVRGRRRRGAARDRRHRRPRHGPAGQ